jgi:ABC-type transport system involved in multi-copper enzyme maturation permease subunit
MPPISIINLLPCFRPGRSAGALFDKELRVASRRRRSYALRWAYVMVLMVFIAAVWIPAVVLQGPTVMARARMETAAKTITMWIVWFQFFGAQLVAIVMMSTAISEEVYGRTLGVLMTTPLSGLQVVAGKFFSRLLQILLLVATSLPLLAIVRILGGIPWDYLVVSLGVTLATVGFVGAVSVFFSALCRRTYVIVMVSTLSITFLFACVPFAALVVSHGLLSQQDVLATSLHGNPCLLLYRYTDYTISPRGGVPFVTGWQIGSCCALLLAGAAVFLACAVHLVRRVALRRALGEPALLPRLRRRPDADENAGEPAPRRARAIRRVVGPPMIWKEMVCSLSHRHRLVSAFVIAVEVLLVLMAYAFPPIMDVIGYEGAQMLYLGGFLGLGILFTITASGAVITSEKERRSWPVLLVTPLADRDILAGKLLGVLRRCGPVWLPLLAYVAASAGAKCFHPLAVVQVTLIVLSILLFLSATGFYFSGRFSRTTEAVTANLVLAGILWGVLPALFLAGAVFATGLQSPAAQSLALAAVPLGQMIILMATTLDDPGISLEWWGGPLHAASGTLLLLTAAFVYLLVSFLFLARAAHRLRRGAA